VIHKEFDKLVDLYNAYWFFLCFFDPYFVFGSVWPDETYIRLVFEHLLEEPRRHKSLWRLWTGGLWLRPLYGVQAPQRRLDGFLNLSWGGTDEFPFGWTITRVLAGQVFPEVGGPVWIRREVLATLGADPGHPLHWAGKIIGNPKTRHDGLGSAKVQRPANSCRAVTPYPPTRLTTFVIAESETHRRPRHVGEFQLKIEVQNPAHCVKYMYSAMHLTM